MEEQFNFDISFDFLDASTSSNVKPTATVSSNYQQPLVAPLLDAETLANKIASVNELVLQLKNEKEEHAKLQKQMQELSDSAMSIRTLYEREKTEKAKYALLSQELQEKFELAESQLANKTLHFEQLSSKIEQSADKGPISYNELAVRYHRLALCLDEDKQLKPKEKQSLQQIQEYMEAKKLSALPPYKKKKKQPIPIQPERRDQGTQNSPEMLTKSTFTDFETIQKKMVSQGTQHTSYTTTRGTNTLEIPNARKETKTQGTQYISSTTTRSTSTSGFIKTHSIGTNFPDECTKLVDDIFDEMIYNIMPLSPLADEEALPVKKIKMKSVGTVTGLKNVRKPIDYVAAMNIKSSDSRPPSRNMYERVKNEVPFMGIPTMNSFVDIGTNPSSVPNNISELWNLLGHTFFSLLQNVNTFNSSMNLNVINERVRNTNIDINRNDDQPSNSGGDTNFEKSYFDGSCRNSSDQRGFVATTRSTATSPIAELENPTLHEQQFVEDVDRSVASSCPKIFNTTKSGIVDYINCSPPVEIQKIILNRTSHGGTSERDAQSAYHRAEDTQPLQTKNMAKRLFETSNKESKPSKKIKVDQSSEKVQIGCSSLENARSKEETKSNQTRTVTTHLENLNLPERTMKNGPSTDNRLHTEENTFLPLDSRENLCPEIIKDNATYSELENELFGPSDDELSDSSGSCVLSRVPKAETNKDVETDFESDIFCKPFMPKKRKQLSIDTRMFHIEEIKAAQQLPSDHNKNSKKKASHLKRKRSTIRPLNKFNKVRICSNSFLDNSDLSPGQQTSVNFITNSSGNDGFKRMLSPDVRLSGNNFEFPIPKTPQNCDLHQGKSLVLETTETEMHKSVESSINPRSIARQLIGSTLNGIESQCNLDQVQKNTDLIRICGGGRPLSECQMEGAKEEVKNLVTKSNEIPSMQPNVLLNCKDISVINVTPSSQSLNNVGRTEENEKQDATNLIQNELGNSQMILPPQLSIHQMIPIVPSTEHHSVSLQCEKSSTLSDTEKKLEIDTSLSDEEIDSFDNELNTFCASSTPKVEKLQTPSQEMQYLYRSTEQISSSSQRNSGCEKDQDMTCTESKLAASVANINQVSRDSIKNKLFHEDREQLEEMFHQISNQFATPRRPVSAIPPCESSEAEDSSPEDVNLSDATTPVKEKTNRKSATSPIIAVKRSERLKAKNLIQQAMEYSSLKIPVVELGKYTKRKNEFKNVTKTVREEKTPRLPKCEEITTSVSQLDFFKNIEDETVKQNDECSEKNQIDLSPQSLTLESGEDKTSELTIDWNDEVKTIREPVDVNLFPKGNKNHQTPTETDPTTSSVNSEDSPSSPPPIDREPDGDHIPLEVPETANRHPISNSLLSQIIANYNRECHQRILQSRQKISNDILNKLQATLSSFTNGPCQNDDITRTVERIIRITKSEQLIAHSLISVVNTAPRPEAEVPLPVPDLYLSQIIRKILTLLDPLYKQLPDMRKKLLINIEKSVFSFAKARISLDSALNLTQFYLAVIADADSPSNPARLFICKCLFFFNKKAIPMIYETLCVYPSVLPHRDDVTYDRSDALISTIQCLLMSTYYDIEQTNLKAKEILFKLRKFYNYESFKPSREEVLDNLVAKLRAGRLKNVSYSFAIISKRLEQKNIEKIILEEQLLPLAHEYYQSISETSENDERIACVLECISYVIKPFRVEGDISTYLNLFNRFLNATDRQVVQEAAINAIIRMVRFGYVQCFNTIYNFQPNYEITDETKVIIRSFVYKKSLDYLKKLECQMQVLTQ